MDRDHKLYLIDLEASATIALQSGRRMGRSCGRIIRRFSKYRVASHHIKNKLGKRC